METLFWFVVMILYMCCSLDCRKISVWNSFIFALELMTHRWTPWLCFWRSDTNRWRFAHVALSSLSWYSLCADTAETTQLLLLCCCYVATSLGLTLALSSIDQYNRVLKYIRLCIVITTQNFPTNLVKNRKLLLKVLLKYIWNTLGLLWLSLTSTRLSPCDRNL